MSKRTLIVSGNCQARFVARLLEGQPEIQDRYRVVYFRAFRKGDTGSIAREDLESCAVLFEQIAHQAPELPDKDQLSPDCKVFRFPILFLNSLWPQTIADPRNAATISKTFPSGLWPYGDRYILDLLDQGLSPDGVVEQYMQWDFNDKVDLERLHHINWAKAKQLDQRAEIPLGRYINDNFRDKRLFTTQNHPSLEMLGVFGGQVLKALRLNRQLDDAELSVAAGGMSESAVPVHPSIARRFGLQWWSEEDRYEIHGAALTIRDYVRQYAAARPAETA